jgi:hypothetical protein
MHNASSSKGVIAFIPPGLAHGKELARIGIVQPGSEPAQWIDIVADYIESGF